MRKSKDQLINYQTFFDGKIEIFDNAISHSHMGEIYEKAINSSYKIGWADTSIIEHSEKIFLHAPLDTFWLERNFLRDIRKNLENTNPDHPLIEKIRYCGRPASGVINCGILSDSYLAHTHRGHDVMLYYANMEWKDYWNGETSFFSDDLGEIVFTSKYKPGRFLWFDGDIPHTLKPVSHTGPKFRFTFSIFFQKKRGRDASE